MPNKSPKRARAIVHCKNCKGVLLKNIDIKKMQGKVSFNIRCPHCQEVAEVDIGVRPSVPSTTSH